MYILESIKKDFFTKIFIINRAVKLGSLRGLKYLIIQKSIFSKIEDTELGMHSSDLIENLSGIRPNLTKIVFKTPQKKKKNIVILLQTRLSSDLSIEGVFDTISIFILKLSHYVKIKGCRLSTFDLDRKLNYLILNVKNFAHLLWSNEKMFTYSLEEELSPDISFFLTFPFMRKDLILLHQNSFLNLIKTWLEYEV